MPRPVDDQKAFTNALLNADCPEPSNVSGPAGTRAGKRFDIYRNNVHCSLIGALESTYPAIQRLVGEEYFKSLARAFIETRPPISPILIDYGSAFSAFVRDFPPLASYPYLEDVAQLEWAWQRAFHANDDPVVTPEMLASVSESQLSTMRFVPHSATAIIVSSYPVFSLFRSNRSGNEGNDKPMEQAETVLVTRPVHAVELRVVTDGSAHFVRALSEGRTLVEAAESCSDIEGFDLAENIQGVLQSGAFRMIELRNRITHSVCA
ncbi:MAG: DNA-binding domain-containing protein [Stappiaceae bacterium]